MNRLFLVVSSIVAHREPHGGGFTISALTWLDWQLKGDKEAARMFVGKNCGLAKRKGRTIERNKKAKKSMSI